MGFERAPTSDPKFGNSKNDRFAKWVDSGFFNSLKKDRIIPPLIGILFNGLKESPTKKLGSPSLTTWVTEMAFRTSPTSSWENYHPCHTSILVLLMVSSILQTSMVQKRTVNNRISGYSNYLNWCRISTINSTLCVFCRRCQVARVWWCGLHFSLPWECAAKNTLVFLWSA